MIITDKFAFVHIPKTAGSTIKEIIKESFDKRIIGQCVEYDGDYRHAGITTLSDKIGNLPIYTILRDPISWYVSWYRFGVQHDFLKSSAFYNVFSQNGSLDCDATIRNAINPSQQILEELEYALAYKMTAGMMHATFANGITYEWKKMLNGNLPGYYSMIMIKLLARNISGHVIMGDTLDFSNINFLNIDDVNGSVIKMYTDLGITLNPEFAHYIRNKERSNVGTAPEETISEETKMLILKKDKFIVDWMKNAN